MKTFPILWIFVACGVLSTILQNGQVRDVNFPDTKIPLVTNDTTWKSFPPNATSLSYKGRWDSKYISWWSAPGLKFGFTGDKVAITFGLETTPGVLVAFRLDGQDWIFTNVTAQTTHQFISSNTRGFNSTWLPSRTFELRVTNWAYGVQIDKVHLSSTGTLITISPFSKTIEIIGDSLAAGMYGTYEGLSSWAYSLAAGLGNVEYSITAYPGICLTDANCWGNARGQTYQWAQTSDTSWRATQLYGKNPEPWDFDKHEPADLVVINLGTNDNNTANAVSNARYFDSYVELIESIHSVWPDAKIVISGLWGGFYAYGSSFAQAPAFVEEIWNVYKHFESEKYVYYFNTTGILQHNDIGPQWHPTDVGQIKVLSHLMQYIRQQFGWDFGGTGPEVLHETLYWNDESGY